MRDLNVIIVTVHRPILLKKCLETLKAAALHSPLKIGFIVVINGSPNGESDLICTEVLSADELTDLHSVQMIYLQEKVSPSAARNHALQKTSAEWVFFADDDISLDENYFLKAGEILSANREYQVFGGPNMTPRNSSRFQEMCGAVLASPIAAFHCANRYTRAAPISDCDDSSLILCNLFVKRDLFFPADSSLRQFSNELVCAEENHLLAELQGGGFRFYYHPDLEVFHERRSDLKGFFQQVFKYGVGRGQLIRSGKCKWFHLVPTLCLIAVLSTAVMPAMRSLVLEATVIYLVLLAIASTQIQSRSLTRIFSSMFLIFVVHFGYGLGVLRGLAISPIRN
jgi:GT2 family glycosyltransferase